MQFRDCLSRCVWVLLNRCAWSSWSSFCSCLMNYPICRISVCLIKDSKELAFTLFGALFWWAAVVFQVSYSCFNKSFDRLSFVTLGKLSQLEIRHPIRFALRGAPDEVNKTLMNYTYQSLTDLFSFFLKWYQGTFQRDRTSGSKIVDYFFLQNSVPRLSIQIIMKKVQIRAKLKNEVWKWLPIRSHRLANRPIKTQCRNGTS